MGEQGGNVRGRAKELNTDTPVPTAEACPGCGKSLRFDAVICVECGFDKRKGIQRGTGIGAGRVSGGTTTCSGCGYSMVGLKSRKCPECGLENKPKSWRDHSKVESARVVRQAYMVPAIMLGAGLGVIAITFAATGHADLIPRFLLVLAVSTALGVLAFFVLCATWIGFDAPTHLTALRLCGIEAAATAAWLVLVLLLPGFLVWGILVWIGTLILTAYLLEIELVEAFVLGVIKFMLRLALAFAGVSFAVGD
jgi:hypothetical protein